MLRNSAAGNGAFALEADVDDDFVLANVGDRTAHDLTFFEGRDRGFVAGNERRSRPRDRWLRPRPLRRRCARRAHTPASADPHLPSHGIWVSDRGKFRTSSSIKSVSPCELNGATLRHAGRAETGIIPASPIACNRKLGKEFGAWVGALEVRLATPLLQGPDGGHDHFAVASVEGAVVLASGTRPQARPESGWAGRGSHGRGPCRKKQSAGDWYLRRRPAPPGRRSESRGSRHRCARSRIPRRDATTFGKNEYRPCPRSRTRQRGRPSPRDRTSRGGSGMR